MRRAVAFLAGLALVADVAIAVVWHQWCRGQGYAEADDELRASLEQFCGR